MRFRLWNGPNTHGGATTGPAYPEGGAYDSGWYDDVTGRCDTVGRQFARFQDLMAFAQSQNEQLRNVTTAEMQRLCSLGPAPVVQSIPTISTAPPLTSSFTAVAPQPVSIQSPMLPAPPSSLPMAIAPSGTPQAPTTGAVQVDTGPVYRFIVETRYPQGIRFDTGASYPACSRSNPEGCRPIQFDSVDAAVQYASEHGEIPYLAVSSDEAFNIIEGSALVDQSRILSSGMDTQTLLMIAAGVAALLILPKAFGRRK